MKVCYMRVLLLSTVMWLMCGRTRGYQDTEWRFTTQYFSSSTGPDRPTITPTSGRDLGPANLEFSPCPLPEQCEDKEPVCGCEVTMATEPVCGSNCELYPDVCYMRYRACLENRELTPHSLSHCTEQRPLELEDMPNSINILAGEDVTLQCRLAPSSGIPVKVSWFEVTSKGPVEVQSGSRDQDYILNIAAVQEDRLFFCQVSDCESTQVEQSTTMRVTIPQNYCLLYGPGHVHTFTQGAYSYQTDCTHVAAMDTKSGTWFVYVRYQETWQISTSSLSTVTLYYKGVPLEIQRGWLVNYFGTKVVIQQGQTKEIFEMRLTFDGLYMKITTPEVSLHWDGVGSLIVGVSRDTQTLGLCGSNKVGEQLRGRFRRRRNPERNEVLVSSVVKSWSLGRSCRYEEDLISPEEFDKVPEYDCETLDTHNIPNILVDFYRDSCSKDERRRERMAGSVPTYCFTQLAIYQLRDNLQGRVQTANKSRDSRVQTDLPSVCSLSVLRRQYLAYYAGCPNSSPPFTVT